jgi:outer membrane protein OmpA-like peptidoglycan-associated protein
VNRKQPTMKTNTLLILAACTGIIGCATIAPKELVDAREDYRRASTGVAGKTAPAEVHVANQALARAEGSFREHGDTYQTRDLAYVAQRKAEMAEATASITIDQQKEAGAKEDYQEAQGEIIAGKEQDLSLTRTALAASERSGERTADKLATEQEARAAADERAADAQAALARLAAVKDEARGMVITLSGSVLFASNQATLLPEARTKLEEVADVLLTTRERNIIIEGHTDSQGSDGHNLDLSQRRADAVRDALVQRGYHADLIQARGMGEGRPIANNGRPDGRANNRRVEIIIERDSQ